jgi:flagellar basal body-associated protein FliL
MTMAKRTFKKKKPLNPVVKPAAEPVEEQEDMEDLAEEPSQAEVASSAKPQVGKAPEKEKNLTTDQQDLSELDQPEDTDLDEKVEEDQESPEEEQATETSEEIEPKEDKEVTELTDEPVFDEDEAEDDLAAIDNKPGPEVESEQTLDDLEDQNIEETVEESKPPQHLGEELNQKSEEVSLAAKTGADEAKLDEKLVKKEEPKKSSFLDELKEKEKKGSSREYHWSILVIVGVVIIGATAGYLSVMFGLIPNPFPQKPEQVVEQVSTPVPSPTEEASPSASINKEDVKVQVLNGTGVPGQAALVKLQLSKVGYKNFTLDNLEREDTSETKMEYSSQVSKELRTEISDELKKIFKTVKSDSQASDSAEFDVIITTGDTLAQ